MDDDKQTKTAPAGSPPATGSVTTTHHTCIDIEGVLRWPDKYLCGLFTDDDGTKPPGRTVRDWLKLQLDQGRRVLPLGKECEGFSYQTGCPGHPSKSPNR